MDLDADSIAGTVDADWLLPGPVDVECHPWDAPGGAAPGRNDTVTPDGSDPYACAWDPATEWDVQRGQNLAVSYREPAGHRVQNVFAATAMT